jgi:hypothetical protein
MPGPGHDLVRRPALSSACFSRMRRVLRPAAGASSAQPRRHRHLRYRREDRHRGPAGEPGEAAPAAPALVAGGAAAAGEPGVAGDRRGRPAAAVDGREWPGRGEADCAERAKPGAPDLREPIVEGVKTTPESSASGCRMATCVLVGGLLRARSGGRLAAARTSFASSGASSWCRGPAGGARPAPPAGWTAPARAWAAPRPLRAHRRRCRRCAAASVGRSCG